MDLLKDVVLDAGKDSLKILPFLLLTYLVMEFLEAKMEEKSHKIIEKSGVVGPLAGGVLGVFPQCGFSAAAANLYAGGIITAGTLLAVFMSTSDEMLPIFISEAVEPVRIIKLLLVKLLLAVITGFAVDMVYGKIKKNTKKKPKKVQHEDVHKDIHHLCEQEHCHCKDEGGSIVKSALGHTIKVFIFLFIISVFLGLVIECIGEEQLETLLSSVPVLSHVLSGIVGLIPNCAASVIITQLYLEGVLSAGAMMSGLLVGAGVGILVLLRMNRHWKENLTLISVLYISGLLWGIFIDLVGIVF